MNREDSECNELHEKQEVDDEFQISMCKDEKKAKN